MPRLRQSGKRKDSVGVGAPLGSARLRRALRMPALVSALPERIVYELPRFYGIPDDAMAAGTKFFENKIQTAKPDPKNKIPRARR
jgi:hypothetical protein